MKAFLDGSKGYVNYHKDHPLNFPKRENMLNGRQVFLPKTKPSLLDRRIMQVQKETRIILEKRQFEFDFKNEIQNSSKHKNLLGDSIELNDLLL